MALLLVAGWIGFHFVEPAFCLTWDLFILMGVLDR